MNYNYQYLIDPLTNSKDIDIIKRSDGVMFNKNGNTNFKHEFNKWVAKGNKAMEADKETE